jgi:hypothetical protein
MVKIGDIAQTNIYQNNLYCDENFCRKMIQLLKDISDGGLCYRLQIFDDIAGEWVSIAAYADCYHRIIPILFGLKDFPKEIKEKIFEENVRRTFEEQFYLETIG